MPRRRRASASGLIFHIVNRGAKKAALFETPGEFDDFERLLHIAVTRFGMALFAYCLMPNHWHLVIAAPTSDTLSKCLHWLTTTHARRWQVQRAAEGLGAVYQGRFRAIPIQADHHFLWVCRYVERNALRANLTATAESWRWCSLWQRCEGDSAWFAEWPAARGPNWLHIVNTPQTERELACFRSAVIHNQPFGSDAWRKGIVHAPRVPRRPGRPRRTKCPLEMTPDPITNVRT
jgi:putative transposase